MRRRARPDLIPQPISTTAFVVASTQVGLAKGMVVEAVAETINSANSLWSAFQENPYSLETDIRAAGVAMRASSLGYFLRGDFKTGLVCFFGGICAQGSADAVYYRTHPLQEADDQIVAHQGMNMNQP